MVMVTILVKAEGKNIAYDMELPVNVPALILVNQIVETLNEYRRALRISGKNKVLWAKRLDRNINPDETLENAGIWDGDYLELNEI